MKNFRATLRKKVLLSIVAVVVNVALGSLFEKLDTPFLFLDSIGTIFIATICGPFFGVLTGLSTNLFLGLTYGVVAIPFAPVNIAIGFIAGMLAPKGFGIIEAIIMGISLGFVCSLIAVPINVLLFDGITGAGTDYLVLLFQGMGKDIFESTFASSVMANMVDKILSCVFVSVLVKFLKVKEIQF
ncbi:MAG: ECF transporter S component [Lachnospirales bacterium]